MQLRNIYDKQILKKKLEKETFSRLTLSFYKYVLLNDIETLRNDLYSKLNAIGVLGRIYLAPEGINAQVSIPENKFIEFQSIIFSHSKFNNIPFKMAVEDDGKSFIKLIIRLRKKIVADGLDDNTYDVTNVGNHLSAKEFNEAMNLNDTIVVDMRNHYESEVGKFENAITPFADTFRDALPMVIEELKQKKENKILLYCTGGIRCEKASAYLKHHGFKDVNQLYGGIIDYAKQIKEEQLPSKFIGKNFVFDERMGERITNDIISICHQCHTPCDRHVNCANDDCHLLFIQCNICEKNMLGCCTIQCKNIALLPIENQRSLRKGKKKEHAHAVFKSRLRPNLIKELQNENKINTTFNP